jgi:hypothetical protein
MLIYLSICKAEGIRELERNLIKIGYKLERIALSNQGQNHINSGL